MNYLAHFYLSGNDAQLLSGNFIADAVKGSRFGHFPEGIRAGIRLHRSIDYFTDTNPVVRRSKEKLWPRYRHYASVIVDVFYDHFLAHNWNEFSDGTLENFAQRVYSALQENETHFPERSKMILPYMIRHDWLSSYSEVENISDVLARMAQRTKFDSGMESAGEELVAHYDAFNEDFMEFFPEMILHVGTFRG